MNGLDWNLLRAFAAVAEAGSLSGAARALGQSQPTLGRHVAELQDRLGVTLFKRHPRGLELTERGTQLYEIAREVRGGVDAFARQAAGLSETLEGTVRISAAEVVAHYALPPLLVGLRRGFPGIQLEVVADNAAANLLRRDADIAVRMFRPEQQELIARHVGDAQLGLYATDAYLAEYGVPTRDDIFSPQHTVVGLDRDTVAVRLLASLGLEVRREDFSLRSDAQAFGLQAILAGVGIGAVHTAIANQHPHLTQILPDLTLPALPLWLVAHADLRRSPRVRAVYDVLAAGLASFYG